MLHWLQSLLLHYGFWLLGLMLFVNNFGLLMPCTTLLIATGFFAAKGDLPWVSTLVLASIGSFMGCNGAYWVGARFGYPLLTHVKWLRLTPKRLQRIDGLFKKYGAKAVFLARFFSTLHPFTGFVAGTGKTPLRSFMIYNFFGSLLYVCLFFAIGYFFEDHHGKWF
jgi:membrane protein DedA with SNARE-associated domain